MEEVNFSNQIMYFPTSDNVKTKIYSDPAEKVLSISQKLFVVVRNLVEEVYMLKSFLHV